MFKLMVKKMLTIYGLMMVLKKYTSLFLILDTILLLIIWALTRENLTSGFTNLRNYKGAGKPGHLHRLISAFVICFLESIISKLAICEISIFKLVTVAGETA